MPPARKRATSSSQTRRDYREGGPARHPYGDLTNDLTKDAAQPTRPTAEATDVIRKTQRLQTRAA